MQYEGPDEIETGGITFTLDNQSDAENQLGVFGFSNIASFESDVAAFPVGTDIVENIRISAASTLDAWIVADSGKEVAKLVVLEAGWYVVDCAHIPPAETNPDHVWRGRTFEVVE